MNYYERVENIYNDNKRVFSIIENDFYDSYKIPNTITQDTLKRILVESFPDGSKSYLQKKQNVVKSFIIYHIVVCYFLFLALFGKNKPKKMKVDFTFDIWFKNAYSKFYKNLEEFLPSKDIAFFITTKEFTCKKKSISRLKRNHFLKSESLKVFFKQWSKFFLYQKLTNETGIDCVKLTIIMFRQIAQFETDSKNIQSKYFISAADNYYSAMRYYIYKKNGLANIVLLQNGYRTGPISCDVGDLYTYADYYFGFGQKQIDIQSNMVCQNKISVGSISLFNMFTEMYEKHAIKNDIDVVFIESITFAKTEYFKLDTYLRIIDNLCLFSKKHSNLNIYYRKRDKPFNSKEEEIFYKKLYEKLLDSGIVIESELYENSYHAVINSKVVLYYRTTLGIESFALNKYVLNCNYDGDEYPISKDEEIGVLVDSSYDAFEKKLNFLLENLNNIEIEKYFCDKKFEFMNMDLNDNINNVICTKLLK